MKKIFLMTVCLLLAVFTLVGCAERVIGEYLPNYDYKPEVVEELTFNVYIVCGAETEDNAKNTVEQRLTQYTEDLFKTTLNIFYIPDTEDYEAKIKEVTKPDAKDRADIVLVTSSALVSDLMSCEYVIIDKAVAKKLGKTEADLDKITTDEAIAEFKALDAKAKNAVKRVSGTVSDKALYENTGYHVNVLKTSYLADLTAMYDSKQFGQLNVQITSSLLGASKIPTWVNVYNDKGEVIKNAEGNSEIELVEKLYTVPNNRVMGSYDYVLLKKDVARYHYVSDAELSLIDNEEAISAYAELIGFDGSDDSIKRVSGNYEDKAKYESEGYYVNVLKYPTVTEEDAFASAFAVIDVIDDKTLTKKENDDKRKLHTTRCMEIIYAFNNDANIHNTLLYGVKGTNYMIDDDNNVTRVSEGNSVYYMNILHTGNVFNSYYCEELGWNAQTAANGSKQNLESIKYMPPVEEPPVEETPAE